MSLYSKERGYDIFDDEDTESDNDTSSEDEIDIILHGTPEQRRKLQHILKQEATGRKSLTRKGSAPFGTSGGDSSSEDDFEKEMNAELDSNVRHLENERKGHMMIAGVSIAGTSFGNTNGEKRKAKSAADEFYDEIYFDSDEDNMEDDSGSTSKTKSKKKSKHERISNDDLLYDPDMDEADERWMDGQRRQSDKLHNSSKKGQKEMMPNSDALLDCPACMTTLCIDCQRHETYKNQYRAMFVMNCSVDTSESLQCPEQLTKKQKKKKKKQMSEQVQTSSSSSDLFHPVKCTECNTVVGVVDADEVYHFFNVLASHS